MLANYRIVFAALVLGASDTGERSSTTSPPGYCSS